MSVCEPPGRYSVLLIMIIDVYLTGPSKIYPVPGILTQAAQLATWSTRLLRSECTKWAFTKLDGRTLSDCAQPDLFQCHMESIVHH